MRTRFKKWVSLALVLTQLQLAIARPVYAVDPSLVNAQIGYDSPLLDLVLYLGTHPLSEGTLLIGVTALLAKSVSWSIDATIQIPAVWRSRKKLREVAEKLGREFLLRQAELLEHPAEVKRLEELVKTQRAELAVLKARTSSRDYVRMELLRRKIEQNTTLAEQKRKESSIIQVMDAVARIQSAEEAITKHVSNLAAISRETMRLWKATKRPDYIDEWLASDQGQGFQRGEYGKEWRAKYNRLMLNLNAEVEALFPPYNSVPGKYNPHVALVERLEQIEAQRSASGGSMGDHFLKTPVGGHADTVTSLRREQVVKSHEANCKKDLGRLSKTWEKAKEDAGFYNAYLQQIWSYGSLSAAGVAVYLYIKSFDNRFHHSFQEARESSRVKNKIVEASKLDLRTQWDQDEKHANGLKAFKEIAESVLWDSEAELIAAMKGKLGAAGVADGRVAALESREAEIQRDKTAEMAKIVTSVKEASLNHFKGAVSLERDIINLVYTEDRARQDTKLNRSLTLIYREAVSMLLNTTDERLLDEAESTVVRKMVAETRKRLEEHAEKVRTNEAKGKKTANADSLDLPELLIDGVPLNHAATAAAPAKIVDAYATVFGSGSAGAETLGYKVPLGATQLQDTSLAPSLKP